MTEKDPFAHDPFGLIVTRHLDRSPNTIFFYLNLFPLAWTILIREPAQIVHDYPSPLQSTDLQSTGLPRGREHGAQVWTTLYTNTLNPKEMYLIKSIL